ncbi:MAG: O-methyltransferase [Lachnospiraceae bacterium]|nr:O-methyltransferase [Lachnospiraceae bacterium]
MQYDDRRLGVYLETLSKELPPYLRKIEEEAIKGDVPILRTDTREVLRAMLASTRPSSILEIGTATAFSCLFMCEYSEARVVTIENFERRIEEASANIAGSDFADRITLMKGDAQDILPGLDGSYDMVLLDAAQGQYIYFLPHILRLLRSGGMLITDNVFIGGDILESRFAVERRKRTIHARMREYLRELTGREDLVTAVMPVGDGLAVTVKL